MIKDKCRAKNLLVCCSKDAASDCKRIPAGIELLPSEVNEDGFLDLNMVLNALREKGIESIMVEGGAKVLESFSQSNLVDCLCVTISPKILGKRGLPALSNIHQRGNRSNLRSPHFFNLGSDCILLSKWLVSNNDE